MESLHQAATNVCMMFRRLLGLLGMAACIGSWPVLSTQGFGGEEGEVVEASLNNTAMDHETVPAWIAERTTHRRQIQSSVQEQYRALVESMSPRARNGYRHLVENVYLPADFDEQVLTGMDNLEHRWPLVDTPLEPGARESTWLVHGLAPRPDDPTKPLQYVVTSDGRYVMNCFACHGGSVYGATYPGAPNNTFALESLTEGVRKTKIKQRKAMTHMDVGSLFMPLGTSNGTSNAVMFGVALMNFRDAELNVHPNRLPAAMTHHDMDAPPWWHFSRKEQIYIDGFAEKGHKGLMQFMLVRENGPKQFKSWDGDFREIYQFLSELRPPKFPLPVDSEAAAAGQLVYQQHCADCHGATSRGDVVGRNASNDYLERLVAIDDVQTDRVRLDALTPEYRRAYGQSWFADFGAQNTIEVVNGYVAPPLDGIWASAPYFHNGSVPTLWHVLHPESRPKVWRRVAMALDETRMGLVVEELDQSPSKGPKSDRRWYFDTSVSGKSASGHDYPNALSESEKEQLLEYLKTL